jgi:hypothetical protein
MPNNKRLIIGSNKLFIHNTIANEFRKAHDIITYSYIPELSLKSNTKELWKDISYHVRQDYDSVVFMAQGFESNLLYSLYKDKGLTFTAGVFVNYKAPVDEGQVDLGTQYEISQKTRIYTFSTNKKDTLPPVAHLQDHQYVPALFSTTRTKRLAQEIYGCVLYGAYQAIKIEETNSVFI